MKLVAPWRVVRHYVNHPLGRRNRIGTLMRVLRWQAGSRLLGAKAAMPFVDGARLLVETGMHGATGNVYVGLMEFEDMAFVLHLLREGDQFLDVGANAGAYSILAGGRGAQVLAMEPVPPTYEQLLDNIHLNRFETRIEARNMGVSSDPGKLRFSTQTGPTNHVLAPEESAEQAVTVAVDTLDSIAAGWTPALIKIDIKGFGQCHPRRADLVGPTIAAGRADRAQRPRRALWLQRRRHPRPAAGLRLPPHALRVLRPPAGGAGGAPGCGQYALRSSIPGAGAAVAGSAGGTGAG